MTKTVKLLILLLFSSSFITAQVMNRSGHFIHENQKTPGYQIYPHGHTDYILYEKLKLEGNSLFHIKNGVLTLSSNYENAPSTLRIYSLTGIELFKQKFDQTINFTLSALKNYGLFYDKNRVRCIDLKSFRVESFIGSTVFCVDNKGHAAFYDETSKSVTYNGRSKKVNQPIYRLLFADENLLVITKTEIFDFRYLAAQPVFETKEGRVFDVQYFNGMLCVSTKKVMPNEFIFSAFSSGDLKSFTLNSVSHYPLKPGKIKINTLDSGAAKIKTLTNETIRNPLYYYDDTVYQPIGNSYDEIQEYNGDPPYLHPGVDLLGTDQQDVHSVKDGYVKAILTTNSTYHWRIAIANSDTSAFTQGYLYAHLEELLFPYAVGDFVTEGDVVGQLVNFPVTGFVHCHFARIADQGATWNGGWWTYDNPLTYMTNHFDTVAPVFEKTRNTDAFAFTDLNGNYLSPDSLYGHINVIAKVYDEINSSWHVDVNKLSYSLSPLASPSTQLLDSFAYEYNFYNDTYIPGTYINLVINTIYQRDSTCFSTGDYNLRNFYHVVTHSDGNDTISDLDSLQSFNTLNFPDDSYIMRVTATDPSGNTSSDSMVVKFKNSAAGVQEITSENDVQIFPNPSSDGIFNIRFAEQNPEKMAVYNYTGQKITDELPVFSDHSMDLTKLKSGIYLIHFHFKGKIITRKFIRL